MLAGFVLAPFSPDVAAESVQLPAPFLDDPADRMIVATARIAGASLVTRDRQILDYGARGHIGVVAA